MNPFHLWLGLPEKSANPNHYQLLGIKSSERDPKAIELAAQERMERLKRVTPNPGQLDAFEKIKQRILKAHATLVDENKRAQYDSRLREKLAQKKQKNAAASHPTAETEPQKPTQIEATPQSPELPPAAPVVAIPTENPSQVAPNIPMAVPIQAVPPPPQADVQPSETDEVPVDFSLTNAAKDPADLSISKRKFRRRRKSWLVPVFCLVLCLGGIVGLVYLVTNYETILGNRTTHTPLKEDPIKRPPVANESTIENVPGEDAVDPANVDPKVIPGDLSTNDPPADGSGNGSSPVNVTFEKLDIDQLVQFRRHLENARRAMYRRDATTAENEIQNAQALFKRFERSDIALDQSQVPLQKMADAAGEIKLLLEGFWEQVVSSSVAIPAGQPIEVTGKTLGFVEGTPQFVILRIDGRNVTYNYEFLAPGIAMALAEQGAKPDVPTYRMQQAAFYAVHTHLDPKYRDRAIEFANRAARDGQDPEPIEHFVKFDTASIGVPEARTAQPPKVEMNSKIPKLMVQLGIVDFRKMRPEQAANAVESTLIAAVADKDTLRKAMTFEVAYMLAVKAGDIRNVVDVLDEYHVWFDYNYAKRVKQVLIDVAKQRLDERKSRLLLSAMINEAETSADQKYKKQLVKAGQRVANKHNLTDLLSRLESAAN